MIAKGSVKTENIALLFINTSIAFVLLSLFYNVANKGIFIGSILSGPLVAWTHLHTIGGLLTFCIGLYYYDLWRWYQIETVQVRSVMGQYYLYVVSLSFLIFYLYRLQGGWLLTVWGALLLISVLWFTVQAMVRTRAIRREKGLKRGFIWWLDLVAWFFLFQVVFFGFLLVTQLHHPWFRSDILHSLRLHSHSGLAGYLLLQYFKYWYRKVAAWKERSKEENRPVYLYLAVLLLVSGLILWTSVHDKQPILFRGFYLTTVASLIVFILYLLHNRVYREKAFLTYIPTLLFLFVAALFVFPYVFGKYAESLHGGLAPGLYLEREERLVVYGLILFFGVYHNFFSGSLKELFGSILIGKGNRLNLDEGSGSWFTLLQSLVLTLVLASLWFKNEKFLVPLFLAWTGIYLWYYFHLFHLWRRHLRDDEL